MHQPPLRERSKLPPRCGKRCETKSQMKTFIHEAVECYLMGRAPYKTRAELVSALEARDPDKKEWGRERLKYHLIRVMLEMSNPPVRVGTARAAPTPPSRHNLTEGEPAAAAAGIDTSIFGDDDDDVAAEARGCWEGDPKARLMRRLVSRRKRSSSRSIRQQKHGAPSWTRELRTARLRAETPPFWSRSAQRSNKSE